MATRSILRNGMVSPIRVMSKTTCSTRSILKRPDTLPLSPGFSDQASPHVQFLPSPSLVSVFTAHSAASYDRAPISVSPLERVYVTCLEDFKLSAPPKPFRSTEPVQNSLAITDFEDPRSPKVQPAAKQSALRFGSFSSNQTVTLPSRSLAKSLASYPRSPYPSAPLTSPEYAEDYCNDDTITHRTRPASLELPKRNKKGLSLAPPYVAPVAPTSSSLAHSVFSPSLDLESRLSQAFSEALSLEESEKTGDDEVMVTALEYPSSSIESGGKLDMDMRNSHLQIMYSDPEGVLWSPEFPQPGAAVGRIRESLVSPDGRSCLEGIIRKDITAPSPNDPFAAFPSFTAALETQGAITYPPRAVLERGI